MKKSVTDTQGDGRSGHPAHGDSSRRSGSARHSVVDVIDKRRKEGGTMVQPDDDEVNRMRAFFHD